VKSRNKRRRKKRRKKRGKKRKKEKNKNRSSIETARDTTVKALARRRRNKTKTKTNEVVAVRKRKDNVPMSEGTVSAMNATSEVEARINIVKRKKRRTKSVDLAPMKRNTVKITIDVSINL
jgi:hypothetical protein